MNAVLNISLGYDLERDRPMLVVGGETFAVKDQIKALGFAFRRNDGALAMDGRPQAWWEAEDTATNRVALRAAFPHASGWNWLPEIGRRGPGDRG